MAEAGKEPYFQGILQHKQTGGKERYTNLFICLVGRQIVIYDDFNKQRLQGKLTLDISTKIKTRDNKNGYKIDLTTREFDRKGGHVQRRNVFKSDSKSDRDIWYGYIQALTTGQVPTNVKIAPAVVMQIHEALQDCIRPEANQQQLGQRRNTCPTLTPYHIKPESNQSAATSDYNYSYDAAWAGRPKQPEPSSPPLHTGRFKQPEPTSPHHTNPSQSFQSNLHPVVESKYGERPTQHWQRRFSTDTYVRLPAPPLVNVRTSTSSSGSNNSQGSDSCKSHQFFANHRANLKTPMWFIEDCTRHLAEEILKKNKDKYGNIMMRESTSHRDFGSYVVDYCEISPGSMVIKHVEVCRGDGVFLMNIDNRENDTTPFSSLSEVMTYMLSILGTETRFMTTNDLVKLGIEDPDYDTVLLDGTGGHTVQQHTLRRPSEDGRLQPPPLPEWRETGYNSDSSDGDDYTPMDDPTKIYEDINDYLKPDPEIIPPDVSSENTPT